MKFIPLTIRGFAVWLGLAVATIASAQSTGTITGRVQDGTTGRYLNNARITVEGANRDTFTNQDGEFAIGNLPPGDVTLRVFYTGRPPETASVSVAAGQSVQRDFVLGSAPATTAAKRGDTVMLDAFTVDAAKAQSAAEIAINEQRFAANIKTVVSTAAFGDIGQDNVGEFLKYLPGVEAVYGDMNINNVSLLGMPTAGTPVSIDGASVVSTSTLATDRNTNFQAISLNNVSRIEVSKVALPDQRADSVGGSVNMVSRSAFERSRP